MVYEMAINPVHFTNKNEEKNGKEYDGNQWEQELDFLTHLIVEWEKEKSK